MSFKSCAVQNKSVRPFFGLRLCGSGLVALSVLAGAVCLGEPAAAVTAQPGLRPFPLDSRGATFMAEVVGDEHFDYTRLPDGTVVAQNAATGDYEVAVLGQDRAGRNALVPSGVLVRDLTMYGGYVDPRAVRRVDDQAIEDLWAEAPEAEPGGGTRAPGPPIRTPIQRPLLTILVEFTQGQPGDVSSSSFDGRLKSDVAYWKQTLYGSLPGSINHYYNDMSRGRFSFIPAKERNGTIDDGIARVRLPTAHPDSQKDHGLTQDSLRAALQLVVHQVDFAAYDLNNDGVVDSDELDVLFVVAGNESSNAALTPSIWAHKLGFFGPDPVVDGKALPSYAAIGELHHHTVNGVSTTMPATVGIIVHELGHLAHHLPDLYKGPTDLDHWCMMAGGTWGALDGGVPGTKPTAMSAWARLAARFMEPTVIPPGAQDQDLPVVQSAGSELFGQPVDPTIYRIETSSPEHYFLLENRQNAGYDAGLQRWDEFDSDEPGGIAIYRVDDTRPTGYGRIKLLSRHVVPGSFSPETDDLFNEETGRELTPVSEPSSDDGEGFYTGIALTDFSPSGPIMLARYGHAPFDCNSFTDTVLGHFMSGRAEEQIIGSGDEQIFLGYVTTGAAEALGLELSDVVTLHVEAPGLWSHGYCP